MVTLVRPVQRRNAENPMRVTLLGIVTLPRAVQPSNVSLMLLTPAGIEMLFRFRQSAKASWPIDVTLLGIVTLVRLVSANAAIPMPVTLSGIVTLISLVQPRNASGHMYPMPSAII